MLKDLYVRMSQGEGKDNNAFRLLRTSLEA